MGTRFPSHQLSNGLFVSGLPEQPKEKTPTMSSVAVPYTGGDIKKSGELGKMFIIPPDGSKSRKSGPITTHSGPISTHHSAARASYSTSGPVSGLSGSASMKKSNSGPLTKHGEPIKKSSGPQSNSGPLAPVLPTTGLITSGPISSGPINQSGALRKASGPLDMSGPMKNLAVTTLGQEKKHSFVKNLPRAILWAVVMLFVMGFIAGGFILGAVNNAILLVAVFVLFVLVAALFVWNLFWVRKAVIGYIASYPDSELRTAKNGQFVKVTGVVTCGNVPLKSSFQNFPRCVFTSTSLYEYRGWSSKPATPTHCRFTWALRFSEKHAVDFYISDFQSGLRALVKAGYGSHVTPYVDENVAINVDPSKNDTSPEFIRWLGERNLTLEDRLMRLKEGYIKEGSTVSVMGIVQRNENVLMIVPPNEPFTTGCQWTKCTLPASFDGLVLRCEDSSNVDVIPV
ncbi:ubiquitin-specific protease family C19-related protein [Striga asiatica]|uniref:Ubiquitin-specific protease family C19-related protein n=1 Tax=Striga asiatica TaxID=4170 RepID=A0A5A7P6D2_STRAF|nr:ubiquitin-specific protease family C19-related protein [Striga asiatica]